jgi:hypothetical protein
LGFSAFFLSWTVPPVRAWWLAPLAGGVPAYALLVVAGAAGTGATLVHFRIRMGTPERLARPAVSPAEVRARLMRHLGADRR